MFKEFHSRDGSHDILQEANFQFQGPSFIFVFQSKNELLFNQGTHPTPVSLGSEPCWVLRNQLADCLLWGLSNMFMFCFQSYYFDRDDVALKNFAKYFLHQSHEEREHAERLMKLQNQRGGRIFLQDIKKPDRDDWENGLNAMECALCLERSVNQSLLELHKLATEKNDPHLCDFIETHYLNEQVEAIKELGDHITNLRKMGAPGSGMAEYLFDKHTLGHSDS